MVRKIRSVREIWHENKILYIGLFTTVILFYPVGFIHEFGHYLVGHFSNSSCIITIDWILQTNCVPQPNPILLYFSLGGIFGVVASLSLFSIRKVRNNKGIFIGISALALDHTLKAVFETIKHDAYLHNEIFGMLMGALPILLLLILWRFFSQRTKEKT